jgi:Kef-type K+ transport system membrane component KefB
MGGRAAIRRIVERARFIPMKNMPRLVAFAFLLLLAGFASEARAAEDFVVSPDLSEIKAIREHGPMLQIMLVLFQLSAILIAAKVLGWLAEKIHVPGVIGELMAGVILGPYLLGHMIKLPLHGHWVPLFPAPTAAGQWPVNDIVWSIAQFASIILLFVTGLHTDLKQFLRYVGPASLVAVVGLLAPFALGAGVVYIPMFSDIARGYPGESVLIPALFVGAILAATSIGITARVLGDIDKLDTPEGVTILGAAVLDDVLGIIALAIVAGMAGASGNGGSVSFVEIAVIAGKAIGIWMGITLAAALLATRIEWVLKKVEYAGATVALAIALAFIASAVAESFGLAFIIGAYSVGLGLSRTKIAHKLMDELRPINDFIVPIFFAALGMLVNFPLMFRDRYVVFFGLAVTAAAIVGKLVGCGLAALPVGFNARGAYRIGLGMLPRGEVALIVAGIGLSRNIIGNEVFGVSIMMTLVTTVVAPILLVPAFARGGAGRRTPEPKSKRLPSVSSQPGLVLDVPADMADILLARILRTAEQRGWEPAYERADEEIYLLRSRGDAALVRLDGGKIYVDASDARQHEFTQFLDEARGSIAQDAANCVAKPAATT